LPFACCSRCRGASALWSPRLCVCARESARCVCVCVCASLARSARAVRACLCALGSSASLALPPPLAVCPRVLSLASFENALRRRALDCSRSRGVSLRPVALAVAPRAGESCCVSLLSLLLSFAFSMCCCSSCGSRGLSPASALSVAVVVRARPPPRALPKLKYCSLPSSRLPAVLRVEPNLCSVRLRARRLRRVGRALKRWVRNFWCPLARLPGVLLVRFVALCDSNALFEKSKTSK
jgi:hypothetical protein